MATRVRYIVTDVDAAIAFYTSMLGFKIDMHPGPGFASISRGDLHLLNNTTPWHLPGHLHQLHFGLRAGLA